MCVWVGGGGGEKMSRSVEQISQYRGIAELRSVEV